LTYTMPAAAVETEKKPGVAPDKQATPSASDPSPVAHGGESPGVSVAAHAHESAPGHDPAPSPEPTTDPPAAEDPPPVQEEPAPSKITICHHTGSKKNPTVTITVGAAAVESFLAKGDALGVCAD